MADVEGRPAAPRWSRRFALGVLLLVPLLASSAPRSDAGETTGEGPPPALSEIVKVDVVAPDGAIDDLRGGRFLVLIRNASAGPVRVTGFTAYVDDAYGNVDLHVLEAGRCTEQEASKDTELSLPCTIEGNEQAVVPVQVSVTQLTRTGKAHAVVDVELEHDGATGNVVATAAISLGVFGESELLPLLQIPSILVLPGALVLVALTVVWRLGVRPLTSDKEFPLAASGLEFWVTATALSAGAVVLWLGRYDRNLLEGYGYRDVAGLLIVAGVVVVLVSGVLLEWRRRQTKARDAAAALRIAPGEGAAAALGKLARRPVKARLRSPLWKRGGTKLVRYESAASGDDAIFGAPLLVAIDTGAPDAAAAEQRLQELRQQDRLAPLAQFVLERVKAGYAGVKWANGTHPFSAPRDDYTATGEEEPLLKEEDDG